MAAAALPQTLHTLNDGRLVRPFIWAAATTVDDGAAAILDATRSSVGDAPGRSWAVDEAGRPRALALRVASWPEEVWRLVADNVPGLAENALDPNSEPNPAAGRSVRVLDPLLDPITNIATPQPHYGGYLAALDAACIADAIAIAVVAYAASARSRLARDLRAEAEQMRAWRDAAVALLPDLSAPWWGDLREQINATPSAATVIAQRAARLR